MKRTLLTLTLAAQFAAGASFAQTGDSLSEANAPDLQPVAYGGDWPQTLVLALFAQDALDVRPAEEIATQWNTLSEEDKALIRRDCQDVMQLTEAQIGTDGSDTMNGADGNTSPLGADDATGAADGQSGADLGTGTADAVTGTDVPGTTGAPGETGTTGETSVTPFTADSVVGEDGGMIDGTADTFNDDFASTTPVSVSIAQMQDICAATDGL
jgi:hypothetical protein